MTKVTRVLAISLAIVLLVLLVRAMAFNPNVIVQPIAYNHHIHVEEEGLECVDCHVHVEDLPSATIPNIEICTDCHFDEPMGESPEEAKLIDFITADRQIPWKRIYQVPDHVYFSHRRHVVVGELTCSNCHGDVGSLTTPPTSPIVPVTMESCINCHKERKVTTDCLTCHR